jgi:hypothetical protein
MDEVVDWRSFSTGVLLGERSANAKRSSPTSIDAAGAKNVPFVVSSMYLIPWGSGVSLVCKLGVPALPYKRGFPSLLLLPTLTLSTLPLPSTRPLSPRPLHSPLSGSVSSPRKILELLHCCMGVEREIWLLAQGFEVRNYENNYVCTVHPGYFCHTVLSKRRKLYFIHCFK